MYQNGLKNCQETIPNVIHPEKHKDEIEIAVVSLDGRKFIDKLSVLLEVPSVEKKQELSYNKIAIS